MIGFKGFMEVGEMKAACNEVTLLILKIRNTIKTNHGKVKFLNQGEECRRLRFLHLRQPDDRHL
jgi:hypothetical protein